MADQGAIGLNRSDIGIRSAPDWPAASATIIALADYRYLVPGWGWWSVPVPLADPMPLLRQLPVAWHLLTIAFSVQNPRPMLGDGALSGTVIVSGAPAQRSVFVIDRQSMEIAAGVTSAPDGTWSASGLVIGRKYMAFCRFDPDENAVIYDLLDPA